ncbi:hypothetical protein [Arthrobacter sp. A5]|uniref:hypothetical protein n=1 Tax=Arthrobacter sp. A5 TaxID=576926 RepID=UPI003DA88CDC
MTKRRLELSPDRDGMSYLSAYLPADTAQGIWNRASKAARAAQGPTEPRTLTQLRVDISAGWLLNTTTRPGGGTPGTGTSDRASDGDSDSAGDSAGDSDSDSDSDVGVDVEGDGPGAGAPGGCPSPQAQILVTVPVFALMGLTDEPAELEGYGPIPADLARRLTAEAPGLLRLLIHSDA